VIKTLIPRLDDARHAARFRAEANAIVNLSHGNLVRVLDVGLVMGEVFLAMGFVEGSDLRGLWNCCVKKQVAFPIDIVAYIIKELCRGLAYAHAFPDLRIVHRNVSPPNALVSYAGGVRLGDFGLALSTRALERHDPGVIYCKVAYISPEHARGEELDGRSDMFSVGIVMWELLTGRQLFPSSKDPQHGMLWRARNTDVMPPSRRAPRVPAELDEICLRALAHEKQDRYADCDEMRMALQTWLAHHAPDTDGARMASFVRQLCAADIMRERTERAELLSRARAGALTLPPDDELRRWVENGGKPVLDDN
jgi:serine/threonine protein kinase